MHKILVDNNKDVTAPSRVDDQVVVPMRGPGSGSSSVFNTYGGATVTTTGRLHLSISMKLGN